MMLAMTTYKVLIFGAYNTGKSQLIHRALKIAPFKHDAEATIGAMFHSKNQSTVLLHIWDLGGQERFKFLRQNYFKHVAIAIYCVDLSQPFDLKVIYNEIQALKNISPTAKIIVAGTKADRYPGDALALLDTISHEEISLRIVTSAKNDVGTDQLLTSVIGLAQNQNPVLGRWMEEKVVFLDALSHISNDDYDAIHKELVRLENDLFNPAVKEKHHAIIDFSENCHMILNGKHKNILHAVVSLAAVAVVTVIAGLVGFGIGFAAGLWTGPGAFISGFMSGSTAAVSVVAISGSLGLLAGGLNAFGLFSKSPANNYSNALDQFVTRVDQMECSGTIMPT